MERPTRVIFEPDTFGSGPSWFPLGFRRRAAAPWHAAGDCQPSGGAPPAAVADLPIPWRGVVRELQC